MYRALLVIILSFILCGCAQTQESVDTSGDDQIIVGSERFKPLGGPFRMKRATK